MKLMHATRYGESTVHLAQEGHYHTICGLLLALSAYHGDRIRSELTGANFKGGGLRFFNVERARSDLYAWCPNCLNVAVGILRVAPRHLTP